MSDVIVTLRNSTVGTLHPDLDRRRTLRRAMMTGSQWKFRTSC